MCCIPIWKDMLLYIFKLICYIKNLTDKIFPRAELRASKYGRKSCFFFLHQKLLKICKLVLLKKYRRSSEFTILREFIKKLIYIKLQVDLWNRELLKISTKRNYLKNLNIFDNRLFKVKIFQKKYTNLREFYVVIIFIIRTVQGKTFPHKNSYPPKPL